MNELYLKTLKPDDVTDYIYKNVPQNYRITPHFQEIVQGLVQIDEKVRDNVLDMFISFQDVLKDGGRYDLTSYVNACTFVSYIMMGLNNIESYKRTFPERYKTHYEKYKAKGITNPDKYIGVHVTSYKKGRLVTTLLERSIVPLYVLNAPVAQKAVNKLAYLMDNSKNERIQLESAKGLLEYLKLPERLNDKVDKERLEEGISAIDSLRMAITNMSKQSKAMITSGEATITDIEVVAMKSVENKDS